MSLQQPGLKKAKNVRSLSPPGGAPRRIGAVADEERSERLSIRGKRGGNSQSGTRREELLFSEKMKLGFAKSLFFGQFQAPLLFPYPELKADERPTVEKAVADLHQFAKDHIDAVAIVYGKNANIPAGQHISH